MKMKIGMIQAACLLAGGALGSLLRFLVSTWVQRSSLHAFPAGILCVNVLGSFLIGFCWSLAETFRFSDTARLFLFTGLFGGFTTFSSFSLDTIVLLKTGAVRTALLNIAANNLLGLAAAFSGLRLGKYTIHLIK